jgi:integrase
VTQARSSATFQSLLPDFFEVKGDTSTSYQYQLKLYLEKYWQPLHDLPLETVSGREIVAQLDRLARDRGRVTADRATTALSSFFAWAIEHSYAEISPLQGIARRAGNGRCKRVLSEPELVAIWNVAGDDDYGRILRLLILTGQRKVEIGDLQWKEVNFYRGQIELPRARMKNKRPNLVPLSREAIEILSTVPYRSKRSFLFGEAQRGFKGWTKAKMRLDNRLLSRAYKDAKTRGDDLGEVKIPSWTVQDIQRSVIAHIRRNGFASPYVMVVNHENGHGSQHLPERRRVLNLWGAHLVALAVN